MQRREVLVQALINEEQVMRRENHRMWKWRTSYTIEARAQSSRGKRWGEEPADGGGVASSPMANSAGFRLALPRAL